MAQENELENARGQADEALESISKTELIAFILRLTTVQVKLMGAIGQHERDRVFESPADFQMKTKEFIEKIVELTRDTSQIGDLILKRLSKDA